MAEERKERADVRYDRTHTRRVTFKFNLKTDADILERLDALSESKLGYVKRLIREDIERQK